MNKGIIDEGDLIKNIELLKLYNNEEKSSIQQILKKINSCFACYNTPNLSKFKNKCSKLESNASTIIYNREEYVNVLEKVITIYKQTANSVVGLFENNGSDTHV